MIRMGQLRKFATLIPLLFSLHLLGPQAGISGSRRASSSCVSYELGLQFAAERSVLGKSPRQEAAIPRPLFFWRQNGKDSLFRLDDRKILGVAQKSKPEEFPPVDQNLTRAIGRYLSRTDPGFLQKSGHIDFENLQLEAPAPMPRVAIVHVERPWISEDPGILAVRDGEEVFTLDILKGKLEGQDRLGRPIAVNENRFVDEVHAAVAANPSLALFVNKFDLKKVISNQGKDPSIGFKRYILSAVGLPNEPLESAYDTLVGNVVGRFNEQLHGISDSAVREIIQKSGNPSLAARVLERTTQFANSDDFLNIPIRAREEISKIAPKKPYRVISVGRSSLSEALSYFNRKQARQRLMRIEHLGEGISASDLRPGDFLIADAVSIRELHDNPELRQAVRDKGIKFIYPEGVLDGTTIFNIKGPDSLRTQLERTLPKIKSESDLDEAMIRPLKEALGELWSPDRVVLLKNNALATRNGRASDAEVISNLERQIDPRTIGNRHRFGKSQLKEILSRFDVDKRFAALFMLLSPFSHVESFITLNERLATQHDRILSIAKAKGIEEKSIYYMLPAPGKSYSMVSAMYRSTNHIPPDHFIDPLNHPKHWTGKEMIVILDDVAGSGGSLAKFSEIGRQVGSEGPVLLSPVLGTATAEETIKLKTEGATVYATGGDPHHPTVASPGRPDILYAPQSEAGSFFDSSYFESLSDADKDIYYKMVRRLYNATFARAGMNVAFPYMAPNNNNHFFGTFIAPWFLPHGRGAFSTQEKFRYSFELEDAKPLETDP